MDTPTNPDRDARGLFAKGNQVAKGHGGSRERARLGRALRSALDEDAIEALARELLAIAYDRAAEPSARIAAMKLALSYAIGTPSAEPADAVVPELPALRDASAVVEGIAGVFRTLSEGQIDVADAAKLVDSLVKAGDAVAWRSLEARLAALEAQRSMRVVP